MRCQLPARTPDLKTHASPFQGILNPFALHTATSIFTQGIRGVEFIADN